MAKTNTTPAMKIYLTVIGISFLQGLQFAPAPVLDKIQQHFPDVDPSLVKSLVTAPSFVGMFFALACGMMVTRITKKNLLLISCIVAVVTGLLPLTTNSFPLLFGCRIVYGFSLGLATALNTAVVAEWFEGEARVRAMGVQAASVGTGMLIAQGGAGILGANAFSNSYFINLIGVLCFLLIFFFLPDTGKAVQSEGNKIRINGRVVIIAVLGLLEYMFLMSYSTNIAGHLSGKLAGDTVAAGNLTSIFSIAQIIIGFLLAYITRITKKATLTVAMTSFVLGDILLIGFPASFPMLCIASVLVGFSQGIFIPTAMVEEANAVPPIAAAMASGVFTCGACIGQVLSPFLLDGVSGAVFGEVTTKGVYTVAAIGMVVSAAFSMYVMFGNVGCKEKK